MNFELQATTDAGRKFVALAEEHAADFATRADQHDREGSFPHENITAMQESGFLAGPIPVEHGGLGVESKLDLMIGISRIARGCASTAIASNMHLAGAWEVARLWRWGEQTNPVLMPAIEGLLKAIGSKQIVACAALSEAGTDVSAPMTEAVPSDDGYVINGRKIFGTMSPAATLAFTTVRVPRGDGYARSMAIVPLGFPGVKVMDNWDAMGMRASGSHDIVFENVKVPAASVLPTLPWGKIDAAFAEQGISVFGVSSVFLGVAEAAVAASLELVTRRKGPSGKRLAGRIPIQELIAENEIDLATARASVERAGRLASDYLSTYPPGKAPDDVSFGILKEQQCMKRTVERCAINIVDRAMTVSGGAGYLSSSPLSRLYRDVRAGPFMQPFAPYEALEFIGKVTLGLDPQLDR
jgi:alkylation response protein AidB-like acyl-CoA dehydrogenase